MSARADRLLGERQSITDSKKFRAAKKKLGIISRRDGFGRGGEWFWELPTTSKTKAIETALDPAAKKAAMVVYAETHSRPDYRDQLPDHGRDDGLQGDPVLLGSEALLALLVSTSPEHREGRTSTALPNRSRGRSLEPPRPTEPPPPRVVYGEGHSRPAQPQRQLRSPIGDPHGRTVLPWRRAA